MSRGVVRLNHKISKLVTLGKSFKLAVFVVTFYFAHAEQSKIKI